MKNQIETKSVYCIFHYALNKSPAWHDGTGMPVTYETEADAVREILDDMRHRLDQIEAGDRNLEDGVETGDWVEPVDLHPDGSITDEAGNVYGAREDLLPPLNE